MRIIDKSFRNITEKCHKQACKTLSKLNVIFIVLSVFSTNLDNPLYKFLACYINTLNIGNKQKILP